MSADYKSVLAPLITQFVATKRAAGYGYETAEFYLHDFDRYAALHPECRSLTGELVRGWAQARDGEDPAVHRTRTSPIREFGKYLQSVGDTDAFVLPGAGSRKIHRYVPHFFTSQEIAAFFTACDQLRPHAAMRARHIVLPVFFRLLYCCGLRTCEARTLRPGDVDLHTGDIDIMQSKGCRSRRIPVPHDLLDLLRRYDTAGGCNLSQSHLFLSNHKGTLLRVRRGGRGICKNLEGRRPWERIRQSPSGVRFPASFRAQQSERGGSRPVSMSTPCFPI